MSAPKSKSVQLQPFPVATQQINGIKLPKLARRRKRNFHTKNPFKVKQLLIPDDSAMKIKKLNGFLLLAITKNDMPHEIFRANLSRLRIVECVPEDFKYFINLEELDVSENEINLEWLSNFPKVKTLRICANSLQQIQLNDDQTFPFLRKLDLSFNYLDFNSVAQLEVLPQLSDLSLSNNELNELPEDMSKFATLHNFDLSDNNFSSNTNAQQFWASLASIPNLLNLNIAKNFLRGIHTERLVAGNFFKLEILDVSYNVVENQHNLICARNFKSLKEIIVTGNPFAILKEHQGIEMEIHARTGGKLINEEVNRPYLRKKRAHERPPIRFEQVRKVEEDRFKPIDVPVVASQPPVDEEEEIEQEENNADGVMFMTEHADAQKRKRKLENKEASSALTVETRVKPQQYTYDEFKRLAFEILGDSQEYEAPVYDLNTAYKTLKNVMNRPDAVEYKNYEEPHYLKPTASIQRYKFVMNDEHSDGSVEQKQNVKRVPKMNKDQSQSVKPEEEFNFDLQNIYK